MPAPMLRLDRLPNYLKAFGPVRGPRLLWQIDRRRPERPDKVNSYRVPGLPHPVYLRETVADHSAFWQCLVTRQYRLNAFPHTARLLETYRDTVSRGELSLIIDGGGNIGLAAIWFASQFPEARVISVEPDLANLNMIERNAAAYGDRIVAVHGGIWNEPGRLRIANPDDGATAYRVELAKDGEGLPAYTIPQLMEMGGSDRALIVKLDVEGAQQAIFASGTHWVRRISLVTIELEDWLYPWRGTSRPLFKALADEPFDYLIQGENLYCFRDEREMR